MKNLRRRFFYIITLFSLGQLLLNGASLPQTSYEDGSSQEVTTQPMLQRVVTGLTSPVDGSGGWTYVDQSPTEPWEYWTNSTKSFQNGDTLVFSNGDSVALFYKDYTYGYLNEYKIKDGVQTLGGTAYYEAVPIEDTLLPIIILILTYSARIYIKRKKAFA